MCVSDEETLMGTYVWKQAAIVVDHDERNDLLALYPDGTIRTPTFCSRRFAQCSTL